MLTVAGDTHRSAELSATRPDPDRWPQAIRVFKRIAAEPIAHFIVLGTALFVAAQTWQAHQRTYRIEVTSAHVAELARKYALQFGDSPDTPTLEALIREDLHDEVLFREGIAEGLDRNDEIVRRRIIQKEGTLIESLASPAEPTDLELVQFYTAHASRYWTPERATFSHIYFADEEGGPSGAENRARSLLKNLPPRVIRAPERGDPFPDRYDFSSYEPEQVARLFGHSDFARAVFTAPVGRWSGPYRSAFGWHLVHVDARTPASQPPLERVRDRVHEDYVQDAREKANAASFDRLARRFTIINKTQR